ncbi:MAG: lauroyl acyltransferase [Alphaproteobacteria bacterium]|nr:lauroyl acyltransferase [Alphaproteobacteria bacterium]
MKSTRYGLEAALVAAGFALLSVLPCRTASALGGAIARLFGPRLPVSRVARRNLRRALPDLDEAGRATTVRAMWDNLGRTVAEYPFLSAIDTRAADGPVVIDGLQHLEAARAAGTALVFVSAHYGNWEILPLAAGQLGLPLHLVYRQANNPLIERLIQRRRAAVRGAYHPKGAAAARELIRAVRAGEAIALLADQKMNDGVAVPFFGRPAMTAPAVAELALRYGLPVIPARVDREPQGRFRVTIEAPLAGHDTVIGLLGAINARFEAWIRARPGHWLWLHRRWPD